MITNYIFLGSAGRAEPFKLKMFKKKILAPGNRAGGATPTQRSPAAALISNHKMTLKCVFNDSEMLFNDFEMFCL